MADEVTASRVLVASIAERLHLRWMQHVEKALVEDLARALADARRRAVEENQPLIDAAQHVVNVVNKSLPLVPDPIYSAVEILAAMLPPVPQKEEPNG